MISTTGLGTAWQVTTVGELFRVLGGGTPKTSEPGYWDGPIPWVTSADLNDDLRVTPRRHITEGAVRDSATNVVPAGSVIVATRVGLGKVGLTTEPTALSQDCHGLIVDATRVLPRFAAYQMRALAQQFRGISRGTTIAGITKRDLLVSEFRLPSIEEQRRVIDDLEKQLSSLADAVVGLSRSVESLDVYRRVVLESAVTGQQAFGDDDPAFTIARDHETAEQLLARAKKLVDLGRAGARARASGRADASNAAREVSLTIELPKGWIWARWGDIALSQNGRAFPSAQYSPAGVKLLRPGNLHVSGRVEWSAENTRRVPLSWLVTAADYVLGPNELVMNLTAQSLRDEFLGRVCRTIDDEPALLNQRIARLKPQGVDRDYMFWVLRSPLFRRFVRRLNTGSLIQHMFTSQLDEFLVPLPPLKVQTMIVQDVERRMSVIDQLGIQLRSELRRAGSLRRALVARALDGRLHERAAGAGSA